ncbi:hypothetical protein VNI00_012260 [Paramarasmius palmivorus]|uniref:Uncharacterized protein n=1 Tax=Paramarasmius palmivorus TaxID=297713 RepID=A0AAW0C7E5_9AGAR
MERVDDCDPRILYSPPGAWHIEGAAAEYNHTSHGSRNVPADLTFQFNGTYIGVYGTLGPLVKGESDPVDLYILDNQPAVSYTGPALRLDIVQYSQRMYSSPKLQDGLHTLILRRTSQTSVTWVDFIEFMPSSAESPTATSSVNSSQVATPATSSASVTATTIEQTKNGESRPALSPGVIAAIVVPCGVLLVSLALLIGYWRKQRRGGVASQAPEGSIADETAERQQTSVERTNI